MDLRGCNRSQYITEPIALPGIQPVSDSVAQALLQDIIDALATLTVTIEEPLMISGSLDGTTTSTEYGLVYNRRQQILAAHDRVQSISYADFGTKDQRVTQIDYTSSTFPGITARKILTYTLVGSRYRRDSITWSIV